jgi:hypothetical protein
MSESGNIDIESLRRSQWDKVCDRMDILFGWVRKRGWLEADAEITECISAESSEYIATRSIRLPRPSTYQLGGPIPSGYVVTFTYKVDGESYEGTTISPDGAELHGKMTIRYNPRNPAQNNSFDSETAWMKSVSNAEGILALCLLLLAVVAYFVTRY